MALFQLQLLFLHTCLHRRSSGEPWREALCRPRGFPVESLSFGTVSCTPAPSISPDSQSCSSAQGAPPGSPLPAPQPESSQAGAGVGLTSLAVCLPGHFLPSPGVWCFANCQFVYCLCFDYWRWEGRSSFCCPILYGSGVSVLFLNSWFCVGSQVSVTRETHSSLAK